MNKYIKLLAILMVTVTFWSCSDKALDSEVTQFITQERHNELISDLSTISNVSKAALSKTYEVFNYAG